MLIFCYSMTDDCDNSWIKWNCSDIRSKICGRTSSTSLKNNKTDIHSWWFTFVSGLYQNNIRYNNILLAGLFSLKDFNFSR